MPTSWRAAYAGVSSAPGIWTLTPMLATRCPDRVLTLTARARMAKAEYEMKYPSAR
jgi:hypothetical protein